MKGAILAGGLGTRLYPLTHATNKHLLPIYDKPMVYYPIQTLVNAGISDIIVVTGGPHAGDFLGVLKNGGEFGIKHLEYAYQEDGVGGIAQALSLCEDFADGGPLAVILGDNTTDADIKEDVKNFIEGALIFLREVPDPERFGVAVFDKEDGNQTKSVSFRNQTKSVSFGKKIIKIEEKPKNPQSNFAVTGLYIYDNKVFDFIKQIKPSDRGQLEITDVNNLYIKEGQLEGIVLKGFWSDAGTFESLFRSNVYWAKKKTAQEDSLK